MIAVLHPLVREASEGRLPAWACAGVARREHMARVSALLDDWSAALGLDEGNRVRWRAAGWLHDALRDAPPDELRRRVPPDDRGLPAPVLHGPAAAAELRAAGVEDAPLLRAVAWHTLGDPQLDVLGRALYAADFLEPGRDLRNEWRAELRDRMPGELDAVVREILAARIAHQVGRGGPLQHRTVAFWNLLAGS